MTDKQEFSFTLPATHPVAIQFSPPNDQPLLVENNIEQNTQTLISPSPVISNSPAIDNNIDYHDGLIITSLFLIIILIISLLSVFFRRNLQKYSPEKPIEKQKLLESAPLTTKEKAMTRLEIPDSIASETTTSLNHHFLAEKESYPGVKSNLITLEQAVEQRVTRITQAHRLVKKHALAAMAVGLVPLPAINMAAVIALQINLLYRLARLYKITFSHQVVKSLVTPLLSGLFIYIESKPLANLVKVIPIIGRASNIITMSLLSGAMTYAVGKVFIQHFESGGTFLDVDPEKMKRHFRQVYEEGKQFTASQ
jgi:uncharacterized protein (DUF697 family)